MFLEQPVSYIVDFSYCCKEGDSPPREIFRPGRFSARPEYKTLLFSIILLKIFFTTAKLAFYHLRIYDAFQICITFPIGKIKLSDVFDVHL